MPIAARYRYHWVWLALSYHDVVDRPKVLSAKTRPRLEDRYALAVVLVVASIIAYSLIGDHELGAVIVVVIQFVTLVVILQASQAEARLMAITGVVGLLAIAGAALSVVLDRETIAPGLAGALLAVVGPPVIVRRLRRHSRIDLATVAGSLCIYLLAGMFFAYVFRVIDLVDRPFFAQRITAGPVDFVYYSFVTMTTLGYGDLTARANLGRMLSITEALFGQLYLVSVVAVLVANIGRQPIRQELRESATPEDDV